MASDHKPEFDKIFKNLQIPVSFKCQYFDTEREDKQRKKQCKDNRLAQDRVMRKIAERLKAARKHDSVPEAVEAGNISAVLLADDLLVETACLICLTIVVPILQPVKSGVQ